MLGWERAGYVAISQNLTLIKAFLPLSLWSPSMGPYNGSKLVHSTAALVGDAC